MNRTKKPQEYKKSNQNNAHLLFKKKYISFRKNTKITESDYISKTKNRTRNIICVKNEHQVNFYLPCRFGHFFAEVAFLGTVWACLGA